mgnify:CR=1 FL=1
MKTIHKKECSKCNGKGTIGSGRPMIDSHICFECNGTGEKLSQKEPEEWEHELSMLFLQITHMNGSKYELDRLEHFISSLLSQQRTQTIEEIKKEIKKISRRNTDNALKTTDMKGWADDVADYIAALTAKKK